MSHQVFIASSRNVSPSWHHCLVHPIQVSQPSSVFVKSHANIIHFLKPDSSEYQPVFGADGVLPGIVLSESQSWLISQDLCLTLCIACLRGTLQICYAHIINMLCANSRRIPGVGSHHYLSLRTSSHGQHLKHHLTHATSRLYGANTPKWVNKNKV